MKNPYGMTWEEWFRAALMPEGATLRVSINRLKNAWRMGECPCDWGMFLAGYTS